MEHFNKSLSSSRGSSGRKTWSRLFGVQPLDVPRFIPSSTKAYTSTNCGGGRRRESRYRHNRSPAVAEDEAGEDVKKEAEEEVGWGV